MLSQEIYEKMKRMHKETGMGMMWCRKALEMMENDYDKAVACLMSEEFKRKYRLD